MPCSLTHATYCAFPCAHLAAPSLDISNKSLHAADIQSLAAFCAEKGALKLRQLYMQVRNDL